MARMDPAKRYELFEHTADIGVDIHGKDLGDLFSNAAFALFDCIAETEHVGRVEERDIVLSADDAEDLMHQWLNEHLYLFSSQSLLLPHIEIRSVTSTSIRALALGERFDRTQHRLKTEIKAVTYHRFSVARVGDHWTARVIFDI